MNLVSYGENRGRKKWVIDSEPYVITVCRFVDIGDGYTMIKNHDPDAPDISRLGNKFYVSFNSYQKFGVKDRKMAIEKFNRAMDISKELEENIDALCA